MQVHVPPSEKEQSIEAIKRAIDRKRSEVENAQRKLGELSAELRGLNIALDTISPLSKDEGNVDTRGSYDRRI